MKVSNLYTIIILALLFTSCGGDDELTFPSKYVYSKPTINDQGVYKVTNTEIAKLTGSIGSFALDKKIYKDSLVSYINFIFATGQISSFELISPTTLKVTSIENGVSISQEGPYTLDGNKIMIDGNPIITLSDDFSEIVVCGELSILSGTSGSNNTRFRYPNFEICTTTDPLISVQNIVDQATGSTRYDTISLDYVNMIYRRQ
jgi:hypothetical protein